jgi:non-ribosomal peptide synthase protein (TIGR01720 family)
MKDIFDHPTIEGLARQARRITGETAQEAVTGRAPLAPVQHRFFSYYGNSPHKGHYNQSVLLRCREQVDEDRLRTALQGLEYHHDALRLVFREDATGVYQEYQPCRSSFPRPVVYDLRGEADAQLLPIFNSLQQDCDPATGPLLRCALIRQNKGDRLLLVIHHLVVDGVSWRIIFEDLETLYNGGSLPARTASYGNWTRSLQERRDIVDLEHAYWQRLDRMETTPLAGWRTPADRRLSAFHRQQHTLDTTLTAGLISEAHHAYGTETIELLLTGLILALQAQGGTSSQLLMLEGHGREEGISPLDISRTVGWFTSMFPVLLEVPLSADMGAAVKAVKEQWRHIPNRGAGYGIYRYCSVPAPLPASCTPEIMFNYMGQFSSAEVNSTFCLAEEPSGDPQSLHLEQPQSLHISVIAIGNKLELEFQYNCEAFTDDTITALITAYVACLQELTAHCLSQTQRSFTPSDFTYSAISNEALEVLSKKFS